MDFAFQQNREQVGKVGMQFLMNAVVCASMAVGAPCHTENPKAGTQYPTREACEDMVYAYNNEVFQLKAEKLDADGQPRKVWTYYCRAVVDQPL
ncbi:hypothetical protein P2W50_01165 [Pseudomonas protegens]|uniref:hypothetical protein n=1 Tax=Pseudomonas protegens TaxID=380021 RepID=UPI0023EDC74E|nr:hypothetical protein [Pseudomonas protegens]MDF4205203.1 hypothetical protein [Pseudomonas protegens]